MPASTKLISRRLLREMLVILVTAGAMGIVINLVHPRGFILISRPALEARKIVTISAEEARIKYDAGAVFIDARDRDEFNAAHIPGAVNVPALDVENHKSGLDFTFLQKPAELVLYCDGPACGASAMLARAIQERGYSRTIYIIGEGIPEWESRGYPIDREKGNGK